MKIAVLYYSLSGNAKMIAEAINSVTNADLYEIELVKPMPKSFFWQILIGGFSAKLKRKAPVKPLPFIPASYDTTIIVSPTWAGSIPPAIRTTLSKYDFSNRSVALISTFAGNEGTTFAEMKEILTGATIIGERGCKEPSKNEDSLTALKKWLPSIIQNS